MQDQQDQKKTSEGLYLKHLCSIDGVKLTRRQVDVIACLMSGKNVKSSAVQLSVSPNTIETHIDTISQKLGSGGRSGIIGFIEKSGKEIYVRQYYQCLTQGSQAGSDNRPPEASKVPPVQTLQKKAKVRQLKRVISGIMIGGAGCLLVFLFVLSMRSQTTESTKNARKEEQYKRSPIRDELPIPHRTTLLERPALLKEIKTKLTSHESSIATVILIGAGGAGKTILARRYARQQNAPVIWELNAETKESLLKDLEALAYALALKIEKKKELEIILKIPKSDLRHRAILMFVKEHIRQKGNWILLFDNVVTFSEISKYYPYDRKSWGKGQIIVTTRNLNLEANTYIGSHNVVHVGPLTNQEKKQLFLSTLMQNKKRSLPYLKDAGLGNLLARVPAFPLDVTTAAHYLKLTNLHPEEYIRALNEQNKSFDQDQDSIYQNLNQYEKTRYTIVSLSLDKLLATHPDFKDLLIVISILDSHNIPLYVLKKIKKSTTVDLFLYHLRQHSFIEPWRHEEPLPAISIHRKTQKVISRILFNQIDKQSEKVIRSVGQIFLEKMISKFPETRNTSLIEHHILSLLKKRFALDKKLLGNILCHFGNYYKVIGSLPKSKIYLLESQKTFQEIGDVKGQSLALEHLGSLYNYQGMYHKAKKLLQQSIKMSREETSNGSKWLYLGIVYQNMGEYPKAEKLYECSLKIFKENDTAVRVAWAKGSLGRVYNKQGKYQQAKLILSESFKTFEECRSPGKAAWARGHLGQTLTFLGHHLEALKMIDITIKEYKREFGIHNPKLAWLYWLRSQVLMNLSKYKEALKLLKLSQKMYTEFYDDDKHHEVAMVLYHQGFIYLKQNALEKAEETMKKSLSIFEDKKHSGSFWPLSGLASVYRQKASEGRSGSSNEREAFKEKEIFYRKRALSIGKKYYSPALLKQQIPPSD